MSEQRRTPGSAVVLGGGIGGLRLANLLAEAGVRVTVLERLAETGGLGRSFHRSGFYLDIGPHAYFERQAPLYRDWIGAESLLTVTGIYGVGYKRHQITSPISPPNLIRNLPFLEASALAASTVLHKVQTKVSPPPEHFDNAAELIRARFGPRVGRTFFQDYIPKVMGVEPAQVHEDWFLERDRFYKEHNLWSSLVKGFTGRLKPAAGTDAANGRGQLTFLYPTRGAGHITGGLADRCRAQGVDIRTGVTVTEVEPAAGGGPVRVRATTDGGEPLELEADVVGTTIPVGALARALRPLDPALVEATGKLRYSTLRCFYFILDRPRLSDKIQIYFPEKRYLFKRIYETRNLNPDMGEAGRTAICVEVCTMPGDAVDRASDEEIFERLLGELGDFYGVTRGEVADWFTQRVPECYSAYTKDYRDHLAPLVERLFAEDRVVSFGRTGGFRYNFLSDRVLGAAKKAGDFLLSGLPKREVLEAPGPKNPFL